ncbi:hypothetical protein VHEMI08197 [[Torrubiella] hemipterigena]|uniref:Carboxypeptidase n=1 Tax=[Torrubiella] hemipterigena TaxID=1531966 RepID=A0A0A1T5U9_9HYPO|nr:hypothetical protein VHEMI08197 [[Torrubiella] hemipterigena]
MGAFVSFARAWKGSSPRQRRQMAGLSPHATETTARYVVVPALAPGSISALAPKAKWLRKGIRRLAVAHREGGQLASTSHIPSLQLFPPPSLRRLSIIMRFSLTTLTLGLVASVSAKQTIERRPDHEFDYILKGKDVHQRVARDFAAGHSNDTHPEYLTQYQMRAKSVQDPSSVGVDTVKQYSGYLDNEADGKHLFFWFFESRSKPSTDPVVLWLNGGPGCSSMAGLFEELGPASIPNSDLNPVRNPYSWNSNANVIFVDQPVGSGFSYYDSASTDNSPAAAKDLYAMLSLFMEQFPQYATQDFHISGESYAGHYIPVTGAEILSHANSKINLKSLLIGNGLTDPYTQYAYYRPMGCGAGGWPRVIPESDCKSMDNALAGCQSQIKQCYDNGASRSCYNAFNTCNSAMLNTYTRYNDNVYDVRANAPSHTAYTEQFLNQDSVRQAIGAETKFSECGADSGLYGRFVRGGDWMQPFHRKVPGILAKIPVLIYAGDADYICNWLGNQAWTNALDWPSKTAFNAAKMTPVTTTSGKEYGQIKHSNGFAFLRVYAAGHMVPEDQPEGSLNFFNRWLGGEWQK